MTERVELDELAGDLLAQADIWFPARAHRQLLRLIEIAREGQKMRFGDAAQRFVSIAENIDSVGAFDE